MNDKAYTLTKELGSETIESWSRRNYIGRELRGKLVKADALIIPKEGYGDDADLRFFPEGTEHLISFLQRNEGDQYIDICIEEGDYKELAEHFDLLVIAGAIVTTVCAPVLVNLISEYLQQRLGKRANETTVKASLTINDASSGKSISLTYEGPASTYKGIMLGAVKEAITEGGELAPASKALGKSPDTRVSNERKQS